MNIQNLEIALRIAGLMNDAATRRRDRCWDLFFLGVFLTPGTVFTLAAIFG